MLGHFRTAEHNSPTKLSHIWVPQAAHRSEGRCSEGGEGGKGNRFGGRGGGQQGAGGEDLGWPLAGKISGTNSTPFTKNNESLMEGADKKSGKAEEKGG